MRAVPEPARAFNAASFEALGAPAHAEGLLGLWLVLAWALDPVTVLLFLLLEDLGVPRGKTLFFGCGTEFFCAVVRESEWLLTTYCQ